jgi:hypothetical protein
MVFAVCWFFKLKFVFEKNRHTQANRKDSVLRFVTVRFRRQSCGISSYCPIPMLCETVSGGLVPFNSKYKTDSKWSTRAAFENPYQIVKDI